jgi:gamma-glutamylcyclotransferase
VKYFAYGSNLSITRLQERAPSAMRIGCYVLKAHDLRFHKSSIDGSGKCDAYYTGNSHDYVLGVLYEMGAEDKCALDRAEGLGYGYEEKNVAILSQNFDEVEATTYLATQIDESLKPYSWYLNHVLTGATASDLPQEYIDKIKAIESIRDLNEDRDAQQRAIHSE